MPIICFCLCFCFSFVRGFNVAGKRSTMRNVDGIIYFVNYDPKWGEGEMEYSSITIYDSCAFGLYYVN